jgi:phosphoesterase RecJ-like protein
MIDGLENFKKFIDEQVNFVISTHESPDADGFGSAIALAYLLEELGKKAIIIIPQELTFSLKFLDPDNKAKVLNKNFEENSLPENFYQIIVDTSNFNNIGKELAILEEKANSIFIIDHHQDYNNIADNNYIDSNSPSSCEMIYKLFSYFGIKPNFISAQAIYTGMLTDTGCFKYPKTSSTTYRIAADCIDIGVNPLLCYEQSYENLPVSVVSLRAEVIANIEFFVNGKVAGMKLSEEMLSKYQDISTADITPIIDIAMSIQGVKAAFIVKESLERTIRVSIRSRGDIDVSQIAFNFGGGGHKNASGYKSDKSLQETYDLLSDEVLKVIS